jgi:hypothetical protein
MARARYFEWQLTNQKDEINHFVLLLEHLIMPHLNFPDTILSISSWVLVDINGLFIITYEYHTVNILSGIKLRKLGNMHMSSYIWLHNVTGAEGSVTTFSTKFARARSVRWKPGRMKNDNLKAYWQAVPLPIQCGRTLFWYVEPREHLAGLISKRTRQISTVLLACPTYG